MLLRGFFFSPPTFPISLTKLISCLFGEFCQTNQSCFTRWRFSIPFKHHLSEDHASCAINPRSGSARNYVCFYIQALRVSGKRAVCCCRSGIAWQCPFGASCVVSLALEGEDECVSTVVRECQKGCHPWSLAVIKNVSSWTWSRIFHARRLLL